jgi:hypothetical protein
MKFMSFVRFFGKRWLQGKASRRRLTPRRTRATLWLEALERREMLANDVPRIVNVAPPDGSQVNTLTPQIQVTFSEPMQGNNATQTGAANPNNYLLVDASGNTIPINTATLDATATIVTIGYNNSNPLPVNTYTLFVHGDRLFDVDDNFALALKSQMFSANGGQNNISLVNIPGGGTLSAPSNYPMPASTGAFASPPNPWAVAHADLTGSGLQDLIVANLGTNQIDIFSGRGAATGGGFDLTPSLVLNLPASTATGFTGKSIVLADLKDLNGIGRPDIIVANADSDTVSVFLNSSTSPGTLSFATAATFTGGPIAPVGIVAADFNNDGFIDLAVADGNASSAANTNYFVTVLVNDGTGNFPPAQTVQRLIGTANVAGLFNPTSIATGEFDGDFKPDLVVGGSNGVGVLRNTTNGNVIQFNGSTTNGYANVVAIAGGQPVSVAAGRIAVGGSVDDIAAAVTGTTPEVAVLRNNGSGTGFTITTIPTAGITANSRITLARLGSDTMNDILVSSGSANGRVFTFKNTSTAGMVSFAAFPGSPYRVDATPVGLDLLDTNGDGIPDLVTANRTGQDVTVLLGNADGTFGEPNNVAITPSPTRAIVTGDLNGDGIPDIAVVNDSVITGQSFVSVMLGQAGGGFSAPVDYPITGGLTDIVGLTLAHLRNSTPLPDIVVVSRGSNAIEVLRNNLAVGATTLTPGSFTGLAPVMVGNAPLQVIAGDFNNDGNMDLAVGHNQSGGALSNRGVTLLLGNGDGTFQTPYEILPAQNMAVSALAAADFNKDGNLDLVVAENTAPGNLRLLLGDGTGHFTLAGNFKTGVDNPVSIAFGDFNNDGFPDVVVASGSTSDAAGGVAVLLNQLGTGFKNAVRRNVLAGTPLQSVVVTDVNQDGKPDILVSTNPSAAGQFTADNVFALVGNGDGTFQSPVPYLAGDFGGQIPPPPAIPAPSYLAVTPSPLIRATTFTTGGTIIKGDLLTNGDFEKADLSGEQGNLLGWQTFHLADPATGGSHGQWQPQTGLFSPISNVTVPAPDGNFQAMLDQADLQPIPPPSPFFPPFNPNPPVDYQGTNLLYQDVAIPSSTTTLEFSLRLYLNSSANFSDATQNPSLSYTTTAPNQQVRVDFMDPNGNILGTNAAGGVLLNMFQTLSTDPTVRTVNLHLSTDPASPFFNANFAALLPTITGKTIRLRIAGTENQGKLIVGVDDARLIATFSSSVPPTFALGPTLRNTSFFTNNIPFTTDTTIIGRVADGGSINNIAYVAFDPFSTGFTGPLVYKITSFDALGNFSFTIPNLSPGTYTVGIRVADRVGNMTTVPLTFTLQGPSVNSWETTGPNGVDVTNQFVGYTSVSGRITAIATDPSDPTGNTYYVASANGGVWKTRDGGSSWRPLTDFVIGPDGNPVPVPIGGMAVSRSNPNVIYAATGVGDPALDSRTGIGVLKSTDGGQTWSVAGDSGTVLGGGRAVKVVIDANNPNIAYVAAATAGAGGPGVYKTTDGGQHWFNVLVPTQMTSGGGTLPPGTPLASVTDLVMDPFNSGNLIVGLGNIGLIPASATAGVWVSGNGGQTWTLRTGNDNPFLPNDSLPSGTAVGRVTIAQGSGRNGDENTVFVLISNPPNNPAPPAVNDGDYFGNVAGLYKSKNALRDFTKVLLTQGDIFFDNNSPPRPHHEFFHIGFGVQGADSVALVVDPTDPNVVYIGGSRSFTDTLPPLSQTSYAGSEYQHALIRVDTGNMRDTDYVQPWTGTIPNDGDDINKVIQARINDGVQNPPGFYDPKPGPEVDKYANTLPEGVYWYDIEGAVSTLPADFGSFLFPANVHTLAFDAQGRLLIGTEGGLWRGVSHGFGYDFTAGGIGIMASNQVFSTPGMTLTAINGNLQISEVTSVTIDPNTPGTYYTSQFGTGGAISHAPLSWVSNGLVGPTVQFGNNVTNLDVPNAGRIRAAAPVPGAPSTDPTVLYRIWQYANKFINVNDLRPEVSADSGNTFLGLYNTGIPQTVNGQPIVSGRFPAFAVSPTKVLDGTVYADELLLGTQNVFRTRTDSNFWTEISGQLTTGFITALAFGPPASQYYYAGTSLGEVFVTASSGGDNWPLRTAGLPTGIPINGITVDPNNPQTAYVVLAGAGFIKGHIFKTTNAGLSWTDISSNLPSVSANAVVVDRRAALGTRTGKLYVATDVGVYVTINEGQSWIRVGNSVPNAPIVDLQQNQHLDELAAAAQGRGVFTISTAQISPIADQIINVNSSTGPVAFSLNTVGVAQTNYSVAASSSNTAVIPNGNIVISGTGSDRTITVTPSPNADTFSTTPVTITLVLTDNLGQSFFSAFKVTVLGNLIVDENTSRSFLIGANDTLTVTATTTDQTLIPSTNISIVPVGGGLRQVTVTPAPNRVGTAFITLTVTDANGGQKSTTFAVDVRTPVVTLPFSDNFNRTDNTFLGTAWNNEVGQISVRSNAGQVISGAAPTGAAVASLNNVYREDVSIDVDVTLNNAGDNGGIVARHAENGDTHMYLGLIRRTSATGFVAEIYKLSDFGNSRLSSIDVSGFAGVGTTTTLHLEVVGDSIKLFVGTGAGRRIAGVATDANFAIGTVGLRGSPGVIFHNFAANNISPIATGLPFNDTFATGGTANQLSSAWEDRSGNFFLASGVAQGGPLGPGITANVSVLRGAAVPDEIVSANVNVAAGHFAGLIARYQGYGDDNMYLGEINNTSGTPLAQIWRNVGGTWLKLNEAPAPSNNGVLSFNAVGNSLQLFMGNTLLTFATDTTFTQGSAGIRGTDTTFGNFSASAAPVTPVTLPFSDTFAVPGPLSSSWTTRQGGFNVTGVAAVGLDPQASDKSQNNPAHTNLAVLNGLVARDVTVSATVNVGTGDNAGLVARYTDDNNLYLGVLNNSSGTPDAEIWRDAAGTWTMLSNASAAGSGTLQFQVVGQMLTLSLNGTTVTSVRDPFLLQGSVGLRGSATTFSNFSATAAASTLPFNDTFAVPGPLSPSWSTETGSFVVGGNTATGQNPSVNLATLPGVNAPNVFVSADVNVAAGQHAGLVARYSGTGDQNMYLGVLNSSSGSPFAQIFINQGGTWRLLASQPATGSSGTLQFRVAGGQLEVLLNGTPQVAAYDTTFVYGAVGMRGSATTFANFNATVAPAVLPFSDPFSSGTTLSNSWLIEGGNFTVSGGAATGATAGANLATLSGVSASDVVVSANIGVALGQHVGLVARHSGVGDSNMYLGLLNRAAGSTPLAQIWLNLNGTWSLLNSVPATSTTGVLRFEVVGTSQRLFLNNTLQLITSDPNLTQGSVGIRGSQVSYSNFNSSVLAATTATLPFSDNFGTPGQLASTWSTRSGAFTVSGGLASGVDPNYNLAVLGGVNVADVTVSALVNVAAGLHAGLVARYSGFADTNLYLGLLNNVSGTPTVQIYRNNGSGYALLASTQAPSNSGTLTFQVKGSALQLSLNGAILLDIFDFNPLGPGSVGIRGTTTTFGNFSAG